MLEQACSQIASSFCRQTQICKRERFKERLRTAAPLPSQTTASPSDERDPGIVTISDAVARLDRCLDFLGGFGRDKEWKLLPWQRLRSFSHDWLWGESEKVDKNIYTKEWNWFSLKNLSPTPFVRFVFFVNFSVFYFSEIVYLYWFFIKISL